jgi:hypothetical protein
VSGPDLEASPEIPYLHSNLVAAGKTWHTFRLRQTGSTEFEFDLRSDGVDPGTFWQPGDQVEYFFSALDEFGETSYYSDKTGRSLDMESTAALPMDFRVAGIDQNGLVYPGYHPALLLNVDADPRTAVAWDSAAVAAGFDDYLLRLDAAPVDSFALNSFQAVFVAVPPGGGLPIDDLLRHMRYREKFGHGSLYVEGRDAPSNLVDYAPIENDPNPAYVEEYFTLNVTDRDHMEAGLPAGPALVPPQPCSDWGDCQTQWTLAAVACDDLSRYDVMAGYELLDFDGGGSAMVGTIHPEHDQLRTIIASCPLSDLQGDRGAHLTATLAWFGLNPGLVGTPEEHGPELRNVLFPAYPNPFQRGTSISFELREGRTASLEVFDITGRRVRDLLGRKTLSPGSHTVTWDGRDDAGRVVASGVYLYRLSAGPFSQSRKLTLLR